MFEGAVGSRPGRVTWGMARSTIATLAADTCPSRCSWARRPLRPAPGMRLRRATTAADERRELLRNLSWQDHSECCRRNDHHSARTLLSVFRTSRGSITGRDS
jgi:hypothetical protein